MKTKLHPGWVLALLCTVLFFYGFYRSCICSIC